MARRQNQTAQLNFSKSGGIKMYCATCGTEIKAELNYCSRCGARVDKNAGESQSEALAYLSMATVSSVSAVWD
jgi:predicted amidophosphoribosyltransferase